MTAAVFPNFEKKNALETAITVCQCLHNMCINIVADKKYEKYLGGMKYIRFEDVFAAADICDVMIVIGGDGTILEYSECAADREKPLLGINTGRLGFMASMETDELYNLSKLISGDYEVEKPNDAGRSDNPCGRQP